MSVDRREDHDGRDRFDEALEQTAVKAAREGARKTAARAAGGYFLLLLILLVGAVAWQQTTNKRTDRAVTTARDANVRLDRAELRACERLQSQRERTNVSEARQFLLLRAVVSSPRASAIVKDRYGTLANTTLYDPPTDCIAAVQRPGSYVRPPSVPFYALPDRYVESIVQAAKDRRPQPILSP